MEQIVEGRIGGVPVTFDANGQLTIAESNIKEIMNNSMFPMTDVINELAPIIRDVEAEVGIQEQLTITRNAVQATRSLTLKKDRPA
jgi:chemotaxis protein histidine kinase CheA